MFRILNKKIGVDDPEKWMLISNNNYENAKKLYIEKI